MKNYTFGILISFGKMDNATGYIDWEVSDEQAKIIDQAIEDEQDFRKIDELKDLYQKI